MWLRTKLPKHHLDAESGDVGKVGIGLVATMTALVPGLVLASAKSSLPVPFLVILVFWLTITFARFGLFAPRHATVLLVLFVCALSVGSALYLILEMDTPFDGLVQVSAEPFHYALVHLAQ